MNKRLQYIIVGIAAVICLPTVIRTIGNFLSWLAFFGIFASIGFLIYCAIYKIIHDLKSLRDDLKDFKKR